MVFIALRFTRLFALRLSFSRHFVVEMMYIAYIPPINISRHLEHEMHCVTVKGYSQTMPEMPVTGRKCQVLIALYIYIYIYIYRGSGSE